MKTDIDFNPDLFINREDQKKIWKKLLEEESEDRLLEFTGIAGQGKTELLKYFYSETKKQEKCLAAYIDLEQAKFYRPEIYPIMQEIVQFFSGQEDAYAFLYKFNVQLQIYLEEFRGYQQKLWKDPDAADRKPLDRKEKELIQDFISGMSELLSEEGYKIILCFDSTERAYQTAIQRLEEQVLEPLISRKNLIVVFAGQQRWGWTNRKLRRQIRRHQLEPLSREASSELIVSLLKQKELNLEDEKYLLKKMWQLTLGHPFSSYKFLDSLSEGFTQSLTNQVIEKHYKRSIEELIDTVVKSRVLEKLELSHGYPPPEKILSYLAPLRRIEFSTFHFILSQFLPDPFKDKSFFFFEKLITEFQKQSYIFTPWILGAGFDVEPVIRNILLSDLRINHQEKFIEIQQALIDQYDRWIEQTGDASQIKNIVERLYHTALLMTEERVENITEKIAKKLKEYLNSYFTKEYIGNESLVRDQIGRLKNVLERDKELHRMIDAAKLLELIESV
ncbi:hypothetical protein H206_00787 [Candidatus Electrothrix aarhusensis]|uniref:NB-ARC domain-containing protein n=1 Tax=Candidatus Electrothrix aarhusensis TaxID=1859131 RepID=A0A3S3QSB1_9BACT|nr:hypothetical protein H206_00787 [Candidatus Electrothrix aarhusensis]